MNLIDLTALVTEHMPVFPGDPAYLRQWHTYFESYPVCSSSIQFGPHTGTHVDAPLHFLKNGTTIASMELSRFVGSAICIDCRREPLTDIGLADLANVDIRPNTIVLLLTGWQTRSGTQAFFEPIWPGITEEAATFLVEKSVKAVGVDMPSVDSMAGLSAGAPAHLTLLGQGMPIFESLINLDRLIGQSFTFHGAPLKLEGCEASPVRAFAVLT